MRDKTAAYDSANQTGDNSASPAPRQVFDRARVQEQLESILASAQFRNSKRYPALLSHLVERTLNGETAELKERSLGVDVFGREPNYDPGVDPVVRISAGEIRKRLAQYYHDAAHEGELQIQLPLGSYVPEFREPGAVPAPVIAGTGNRRFMTTLSVAGLALLALLALWWRPAPRAIDDFWRPVVSPAGSVMVCVGEVLGLARRDEISETSGKGANTIVWADALTLARLGVFLHSKGATPQFCRENQATFNDFQQGPAVLIGGLNDAWALRLMENLRFQFRREGSLLYIEDRENPSSRKWSIVVSKIGPDGRIPVEHDYAVISRVANPRTGRMTVTLAGLWGYGTVAASQFLTDPKYLQAMAKNAPTGWERKNLQLVIGTEVIDNSSGPPSVLAMALW